ncbi:hypothetical protein D9M68_921510 [compost metagenome]
MTIAAVVVPGDLRQGAHLVCGQRAVGDGDPQHVGVLLHIQSVLQTQRKKFLLAQLAGHPTLHLIAELRHTLMHKRSVVIVIVIHARLPFAPSKVRRQ